jgi:predicted TIM-barrel fold metal-dependent hydrolase
MTEDRSPEELEDLRQAQAWSHQPEASEAQTRAVAGWNSLLAKDFAPRPTLRVPVTAVTRAKFPVIDVHKHLGFGADRGWPAPLEDMLSQMDALNIQAFVNLDGLYGPHLRRTLDRYPPDRFFTFAGPAWHRWAEPDFVQREVKEMEASVKAGARGYKIFKSLGLRVRDSSGALWMPDDPRLDPLWDTAGGLNIPVLIHVADPESFFLPADQHNERMSGLGRRPEWYFGTDEFPAFDELIERQLTLYQRHPKTTFFGAHVMNRPDNLGWVGKVLDACPNAYAEISARISDLGRQPRTAKAFFTRYQDQVLFGTDGSDMRQHPNYFRVLETADDLILPESGTLPAGSAPLYGIDLPDDVLRKLYHDNAARIFKAK